MREIKFRGKRKDNGEWVYGSLYKFNGIYYIIKKNIAICPLVLLWKGIHIYEIIPETLGQYTGLKYENKEMFEGDIVKCLKENPYREWEEFIGVVKWHVGGYWKITNDEEWVDAVIFIDLKDVEIIGNIYDNPELIGGKDG